MFTIVLGRSVRGKLKEMSFLDGTNLTYSIFRDILTAAVAQEGALMVHFVGSGKAGGMDMKVTVLFSVKGYPAFE